MADAAQLLDRASCAILTEVFRRKGVFLRTGRADLHLARPVHFVSDRDRPDPHGAHIRDGERAAFARAAWLRAAGFARVSAQVWFFRAWVQPRWIYVF